jgi:membrane-associated protein
MEFISTVIDLFLHLDTHLTQLVEQHQTGVYAILFFVIFAETGFVVTPFLPGDSLLFACGALAARGSLSLFLVLVILSAAAILGNFVNYAVGRRFGERIGKGNRWVKPRYLERTAEFYERYGAKMIVITRFVPIVRTFAPFLAGVTGMTYRTFSFYNIAGGLLWVVSLTVAGYMFGNLPVVEDNFTLIVLAIIGISLLPVVFEAIKERKRTRA